MPAAYHHQRWPPIQSSLIHLFSVRFETKTLKSSVSKAFLSAEHVVRVALASMPLPPNWLFCVSHAYIIATRCRLKTRHGKTSIKLTYCSDLTVLAMWSARLNPSDGSLICIAKSVICSVFDSEFTWTDVSCVVLFARHQKISLTS